MADKVLLRFRDLVGQYETIEEHNRIVDQRGRVLWGWWKKPLEPMPDPGLTMVQQEIGRANDTLMLIDSGTRQLYEAPLLGIHYTPGGVETVAPQLELCPEYYRDKQLPAWFEIGKITEVQSGPSALAEYVFSDHNRSSHSASSSSLHSSHIGRHVSECDFLDSNLSLWFVRHITDLGVVTRSEVVPSISTGLWSVRGKYILHLSDLHFGSHHAYRNELASISDASLGKESLSEALVQDLKHIGIKSDEIALILVSGDLTWSGDAHEFANAGRFLRTLGNELGLHPSQIVIIPGNHDIEWRHEAGDIDSNAELNYVNFVSNFYKSLPRPSLLRIHRFLFGDKKLSIVGLNSCRIESKANAGLGYVGRAQVNEFIEFFSRRGIAAGDTIIALVHHHLLPVNYIEEINWETKRLSIMLDAEAVMRALIAVGAQVVLHGHQHQPYVAQLRRVITDHVNPADPNSNVLDGSIRIVGGGSIGVERGHLNLVGRNTYNIISLVSETQFRVRTRAQSSVGPGFCDYQDITI